MKRRTICEACDWHRDSHGPDATPRAPCDGFVKQVTREEFDALKTDSERAWGRIAQVVEMVSRLATQVDRLTMHGVGFRRAFNRLGRIADALIFGARS